MGTRIKNIHVSHYKRKAPLLRRVKINMLLAQWPPFFHHQKSRVYTVNYKLLICADRWDIALYETMSNIMCPWWSKLEKGLHYFSLYSFFYKHAFKIYILQSLNKDPSLFFSSLQILRCDLKITNHILSFSTMNSFVTNLHVCYKLLSW